MFLFLLNRDEINVKAMVRELTGNRSFFYIGHDSGIVR